MQCPKCDSEGYIQGNQCISCLQNHSGGVGQAEAPDFMTDALAATAFALFFLVCFYIFPDRRGHDWFHFQWADVIGAGILFVIGYLGIAKMKDD